MILFSDRSVLFSELVFRSVISHFDLDYFVVLSFSFEYKIQQLYVFYSGKAGYPEVVSQKSSNLLFVILTFVSKTKKTKKFKKRASLKFQNSKTSTFQFDSAENISFRIPRNDITSIVPICQFVI